MSFVVGEAGAAGAVATAAPSDSTAHTILLLQITSTIESRTYLEFEHPMQAVEGAIGIYEDRLRKYNPLARRITYTIEDLHAFFDGLADIACLVFDAEIKAYVPKPPEWIKQSVLKFLQRRAMKTR